MCVCVSLHKFARPSAHGVLDLKPHAKLAF